MPARYMTYPNGGPVLPSLPQAPRRPVADGNGLMLDTGTLWGWGRLLVPRHLWQALGRFSCWIEPALVTEWQRLMHGYAGRQDRVLDPALLAAAMGWAEPGRDVALPRTIALRLIQGGQTLRCVWSGRPLRPEQLDIDHCRPWAAWPCGDLWNLVPADRVLNQQHSLDRQNQKQRRLSSGLCGLLVVVPGHRVAAQPCLDLRNALNGRHAGHYLVDAPLGGRSSW